MASSIFSTFFPSSFIFFAMIFFCVATAETQRFARLISPLSLGIDLQHQQLSHLHFFFHDIVSGPNQTAVRVAAAQDTDKSPSRFGEVMMIDDPLTEQPESTSNQIGRAQGIYASASQSELGLLMTLNFVFTQGEYNGSTLSVLGRNTVASAVREMPVVGGSGVFRFARGYAQARTHSFTPSEAVVEYDVYVFHY